MKDFVKKMNTSSGDSGFTLIELLAVIAIVAILAAIAVTSYIGVQLKALRSEAYSNLQTIRLLEEQVFAENACYQPLVAGVCPAGAAIFDYTATDNPPAAPSIEDLLRGFRPGGCRNCPAPHGLNFTYRITQNVALPPGVVPVPYAGATVAQTPCFVATATGVAGTRVAGDVFAIDCNNNRNF
jgi:prepilin-type N-terminal cleavage/methylation domain-containing protein